MSARTDYTELDALIVERIGQSPCNFTQLQAPHILSVATTLAIPDRWGVRTGWRVIDRRLQALRKANRIAYSGGEWHAKEAA